MSDDLISDDGPEADDLDEWEADQEQRIAECARLIIECHTKVVDQIGNVEAWELFNAFAKHVRPRRRKGAHDRAFDTGLLAAYDAAPEGRKGAAAVAYGTARGKSPEATRRHLHRLQADRKRLDAMIRVWVADE